MEFDEIYSKYLKPVYGYVLQLSCDESIAEEVTSETFLRALKSIDHFRNDCDIRVWLCQIAKHTYFSYLKRNKKLESVSGEDLETIQCEKESIEAQFLKQEEAHQIQHLLHHLSEPYKEVFMWRVFGELSFKEIGELYQKTDNWACVTYHRARKMIQSRLEETYHE